MKVTPLMETVKRAFSEPEFRASLLQDPEGVLATSHLSPQERQALLVSRPALAAMGADGVPHTNQASPLSIWL